MSDSDIPDKFERPVSTTGIQYPENLELIDFNRIKNYKLNIFFWSLYDLANTIYSMGIVSLVIVPYVLILAIANVSGVEPADLINNTATVSRDDFNRGVNQGNLYYGIIVFVGNMIMAVISPFLGAFADQLSKRKYLLVSITSVCLIFIYTISLKFSIWWVLIFFLLANLAYQMSLIVYDSMIPFLAKPDQISKVSGFGVAFGYFGSFIALGLATVLSTGNKNYQLNDDDFIIKIGYIPEYIPFVAIAFLLLGFPILFTQEARLEMESKSLRQLLQGTWKNFKETASEVLSVDDTKYFMIGWLLFVDTANTVIAFMSVLITLGLGLPEGVVLIVLGIGVASAVIFTYPVGWLGDKIGPKKLFNLIAILWTLALLFGLITNVTIFNVATPGWFAYVMAIIVGPALGGTWVAQRLMLSQLAPKDRTSNYFGIANVFGRISSSLGPLIFAGSVALLIFLGLNAGTATRLTMIVLIFVLFLGMYLISKVEDHHEAYINGYRHIGNGVWTHPEEKINSKYLD